MENTLKDFLAFCESKPTDERYEYWNTDNCAGAQYAKSLGTTYDECLDYSPENREKRKVWCKIDSLAGVAPEQTFGSLAKHVRKELEST